MLKRRRHSLQSKSNYSHIPELLVIFHFSIVFLFVPYAFEFSYGKIKVRFLISATF